jgi:hypothetical protein
MTEERSRVRSRSDIRSGASHVKQSATAHGQGSKARAHTHTHTHTEGCCSCDTL